MSLTAVYRQRRPGMSVFDHVSGCKAAGQFISLSREEVRRLTHTDHVVVDIIGMHEQLRGGPTGLTATEKRIVHLRLCGHGRGVIRLILAREGLGRFSDNELKGIIEQLAGAYR